MFLRTHFLWWPIHPIGYAVGHSFNMDLIWTPMFVSWCLKKVILQYGGIRLYRKAMPFFIGLLLGDYLSGSIFSLIGTLLDIPMYRVFPNWAGASELKLKTSDILKEPSDWITIDEQVFHER